MVYYNHQHLTIRNISKEDLYQMNDAIQNQGWPSREQIFIERLEKIKQGQIIGLIALWDEVVAGMVFLYPKHTSGPFKDIPFIEDLLVLKAYQGKRIGAHLLNVIESIAKTFNNQVALAVGLHAGYGNAHILYAKKGYIPSGCGVWYQNHISKPYETVNNDDDLLLYMSKNI